MSHFVKNLSFLWVFDDCFLYLFYGSSLSGRKSLEQYRWKRWSRRVLSRRYELIRLLTNNICNITENTSSRKCNFLAKDSRINNLPKPNSPRYDLLFNHLRQGIRSSEVAGVELDCHAVLIYFEQTSHRTFLDTCRICSDRLACNVASFKSRDVFHSNSMVFLAHSPKIFACRVKEMQTG